MVNGRPFRSIQVNKWSVRKVHLCLELGIGSSVGTTPPHVWGHLRTVDWLKFMETLGIPHRMESE